MGKGNALFFKKKKERIVLGCYLWLESRFQGGNSLKWNFFFRNEPTIIRNYIISIIYFMLSFFTQVILYNFKTFFLFLSSLLRSNSCTESRNSVTGLQSSKKGLNLGNLWQCAFFLSFGAVKPQSWSGYALSKMHSRVILL